MSASDPPIPPEPWVARLKCAVDAGYYQTEADVDHQEPFPWQGKTCRDCPFWLEIGFCRVLARSRAASAHTCEFFDPVNRDAAEDAITQLDAARKRAFLRWFNPNRG